MKIRSSVAPAALAVFLVAVAIRLAFLAAVPGWHLDTDHLTGDSIDFHTLAVNLDHGRGYALEWRGAGPLRGHLRPTAFRAPVWPAMVAGVYKVTGSSSPTTGRVAVVLIDAATCALVVVLGTRLATRRVGVAAGLLCVIYLPLLANTTQLLSDPLFGLLMVLVLLAADHYRRAPSLGRAAVVGLLLGVSILTRANGSLVAIPIVLWMAWTARRSGWPVVFARAGVAALVGVAVIVPWLVRNEVRMHAFVPVATQSGSVLGGAYNSKMTDRGNPSWGTWDYASVIGPYFSAPSEVAWDRTVRKAGLRWMGDHKGGTVKLWVMHAQRYFDLFWEQGARTTVLQGNPSPSRTVNLFAVPEWWLLAVLGVLGVVDLRRRHVLGPWVPGLLLFAGLAFSGVFLADATRYRAPGDFVVILLAAVWISERVRVGLRPAR
ncbi:MAG: glycosyltransferase family 39 protein [Actinobacteria bacterium]|nr:glycosyltransferase family 39 protein [Actinomycetota bacterium]